ncbi:hypothetical protein [Rhizobium sp. SYY.PMSO]|uniref:hypothetical protein n=1 Tax=Rhizobium sp. SYY.PMSO TaxID=3382192 RepID=UPI00398F9584
MEDMFLESGDNNNYNQESLLRSVVTIAKKIANPDVEKVNFDSPLRYDIQHVANAFRNLIRETKDAENSLHVKFKDTTTKTFDDVESQLEHYCKALHEFAAPERGKINKGPYADGSIDKFERRIRSKISNSRFDFIFAFANSEAGGQILVGVVEDAVDGVHTLAASYLSMLFDGISISSAGSVTSVSKYASSGNKTYLSISRFEALISAYYTKIRRYIW